MTWAADLSYELLDFDCDTVLTGFVPRARPAPTFDRRLSSAGSGKLAVDPGGLSIGALNATFLAGRYVRVLFRDEAIFTWRIEGDGPVAPGIGDEKGYLALRGRGHIADWDFANVQPYGGWDVVPMPDQRIFNAFSPDFPNAGSWAVPDSMGVFGSHPAYVMLDGTGTVVPAPANWPEPSAYYIWPVADSALPGRAFFRSITVTLTEETNVALVASADNYWEVYANGVPIAAEVDKLTSWMEHRRVEKVLPAGEYIFGAMVHNPDVATVSNIGMFLFSLFTMDGEGNPDTILLQSDVASWTCVFVDEGDPWPGWTPGQVINTLLSEAHSAGELLQWDSAVPELIDNDGDDWGFIPHWAIGVGESLLRAIVDLADQGHCDWEALPNQPWLEAWLPGVGVSSGVILRDVQNAVDGPGSGVCLHDPDFGKQEQPINRIRARYPGGYVTVDGDLTNGVFAGLLTTDARNRDEATRLATEALAKTDSTESSISWRVAPRDDPTTPFVGFTIRDSPTVVDSVGDLVAHRTVGIVVQDGVEPSFIGHWRRRRIPAAAKQMLMLRSLGSGVLGNMPGSVPKTASGLGQAVPSQTPVLESRVVRSLQPADFPAGVPGVDNTHEATFNFPGPITTTEFTDWFPTRGSNQVHINEVRWALTVAPSSGDLEFCLEDDGWAGVIKTWSENADTTRNVDNMISEGLDGRSLLRIRITDAVSGDAEGLTVCVVYECCFPV